MTKTHRAPLFLLKSHQTPSRGSHLTLSDSSPDTLPDRSPHTSPDTLVDTAPDTWPNSSSGPHDPSPWEQRTSPVDTQEAMQGLFRRWLVSQGKSRHTVLAYTHNVRQWIAYVAEHAHEPVTMQAVAMASTSLVRSFLTHRMKKGIDKTSQAQWMASVKSFYHCLMHTGYATKCPISRLQRPRLPRRLPRPLSHEHVAMLLKAPCEQTGSWVDWRNYAIVVVLYATGWRIQELLNLNHGDWRPPFDHITVVGKGQKSRTTPLLPIAQEALQRYLRQTPRAYASPQSPLFIGERGGRLCAGVVQRMVRQWRESSDLPSHVTPHSLRHSFATHLLDSGTHLRHVQELLGHVSVQSTQHYVQTTLTRLQALYTAAHPTVKSDQEPLVMMSVDSDADSAL